MRFHPDVEAFFATIQAINPPPFHTLPVAEARAAFARSAQFFGGPVVEMASVEDREIDGAESKLPIRIYRPHGLPDGPAPALIYFHGGGWTIGSIETHDKLCRQIAGQALCAVVSVEYRLAPEYPLPAAPLDAIASTASLHAHAAELDLDPQRLAVGGDSAGGALAGAASAASRDAGIPLRAQILIYPSADVRPGFDQYPSKLANGDVLMLSTATKQWFGRHSLPLDSEIADALVHDPRVSIVLTPDVAELPPTLVLTAERDILRDEGRMYAMRLEDAGVEVLRRDFPGQVHGFVSLGGALSDAALAVETIALFLRQRLIPGSIL